MLTNVYITKGDVEVLEDCYSLMINQELDIECYETRNLMKSLKDIINDLKEAVNND